MNFSNATMRPGRVLEVYPGGKIKASVPGLFNKNDIEGLPLLSQFMMGGSPNSFSSPQVHDEIWVLSDNSNPDALYWFRKDKADSKNFEESEIEQSSNVEVLCNKETDTGWATIKFDDGSGWVIQNNDVAFKLNKDGSIVLSNGFPSRTISISKQCISLGSEGMSEHPAAFGDGVEDALRVISRALKSIREWSSQIGMLMPIAISLGSLPEELDDAIVNVSSRDVYID